MIDFKMQYQVGIFADLAEISPRPDNISTLLQAFRDKELIPNVYQEVPIGGRIPPSNKTIMARIALNSLDAEWNISIGSNRLDIEKKPIRAKGENMGNVDDFCRESIELLARFVEKFNFKANRLTLVTGYMLEEMTPQLLSAVFHKFMNPLPFFTEHEPFEWGCRVAAKSQLSFASLNEQINALTTVSRGRGEIGSVDGTIPFDRIQVLLDINTVPEVKEPRFELDHIRDYYQQVITIHDLLLNEVESSIHE